MGGIGTPSDEAGLDQFIEGRGDRLLFLNILTLGNRHLVLAEHRLRETVVGPNTLLFAAAADVVIDLNAEALIQAHGRAWAEASESGSVVTDVDRLPAPKDVIKATLLLGMGVDSDLKGIDLIKSGYLALARFQPGVGNRRIIWQPTSIPDKPLELVRASKN